MEFIRIRIWRNPSTSYKCCHGLGCWRVWNGNVSCFRYGGYVGYIDSFYSPLDDSFPALVRATEDYTTDYWTTKNTARMLHAGGTEVDYKFNWDTTMVDEGYPNKRSNEYTFKRPELYYADDVEFNEVRGRPKGLYYGKQDRLANGSFVSNTTPFCFPHIICT